MNRYATPIVVLGLGFLLAPRTQVQAVVDKAAETQTRAPTITVTKLDVNYSAVELSWEIRNDSGQEIWILAGLDRSGRDISAFMDEDGRTLLLRRRLDVRAHRNRSFPICNGRYVRLRAGQNLTESVSLTVPVHPHYGISGIGRETGGRLEYATRLAIEIGYYTGDLPGIVRRAIAQDEKNPRVIPPADPYYPDSISGWFRGLLGFNRLNELVRSRDDEVLIPFTDRAFTGEQFLRVVADDLRIPYKEEEKADTSGRRYPPDLSPCTRVEIQYQPSALEYSFPYISQQRLLSSPEKEHLQSTKSIVVQDPEDLNILADDLRNVKQWAEIVCQRTVAHIVCYRDNERLMSFPIYNDDSIVTEGVFRFEALNGSRSLRMVTPQVERIDLRVRCAANLKHLWHRLRLYQRAAKSLRVGLFRRRIDKPYPDAKKWCDYMVWAYRTTGMLDKFIMRPHICPSADEGKCHYAMNPNCKYDSPPDIVLLFETKAGWNQHGGPELFTFDNHDPKGGCVLLNDGTVRFIRSKNELEELRWK